MAPLRSWPRWLLPVAAALLCVAAAPVAAGLTGLAWRLRWQLLPAIAAAEFNFYLLYFRRRYREFNQQPEVHAPSRLEAMSLFRRFLALRQDLPQQLEVAAYLSTWFRGAPFSDIRRDNVAELMAYGFWYKSLDQMRDAGLGHVPGEMVDEVERVFAVKFPPGYNRALSFMGHLWEPLRASYRPLAFYAATEVLALGGRLALRAAGFEQHKLGGVAYYTCGLEPPATPHLNQGTPGPVSRSSPAGQGATHAGAARLAMQSAAVLSQGAGTSEDGLGGRQHMATTTTTTTTTNSSSSSSSSPTSATTGSSSNGSGSIGIQQEPAPKPLPVLFLHGVGGVSLYVQMIRSVAQLGSPMVVLDMKHVALRLMARKSERIPDVDELCSSVVSILDAYALPQVVVVAHSYGTFVASRLAQTHQQRLASLCLIDPVCFGMFIPHLLHNFIYRRPRLDIRRPLEALRQGLLFLASRDLHLAAALARRFYWSDLNLWPDDLPPGSVVLLSGQDDLVAAQDVKAMLEKRGNIKVLYTAHAFHGSFLLDAPLRASLLAEVTQLLSDTGRSMAALAAPLLQPTLRRLTTFMEGRSWASAPRKVVRSLTDSLSALTAEERQQLQLGWHSPPQRQQQRQQEEGCMSAAPAAAAGGGSTTMPAATKLHMAHSADDAVLQHVQAAAAAAAAAGPYMPRAHQNQAIGLPASASAATGADEFQRPPDRAASRKGGEAGGCASDLQPVKDQEAAVLGASPDQSQQSLQPGPTPVATGSTQQQRGYDSQELPPSPRSWARLWAPAAAAAVASSSPPGRQRLSGLAASPPVARRSSSFMAPTPLLASDIEVALQALQLANNLQGGQQEVMGANAPEDQQQLDRWQQEVQQPLGTCEETGGSKSSCGSRQSSEVGASAPIGQAAGPSTMVASGTAVSAAPSSPSSGSQYSSAASAPETGLGGQEVGGGVAAGAVDGGLAAVAAQLRRQMAQAGIR